MNKRPSLFLMIPILMAGVFCSRSRLSVMNDLEEMYNAGRISNVTGQFKEDAFIEVRGLFEAKGKKDIQEVLGFLRSLGSHIHFSALRLIDGEIVGNLVESNQWLVKSGVGKAIFSFRLGGKAKEIGSIHMEMSRETQEAYTRLLNEFQNWFSNAQRDGSHEKIPEGKTPPLYIDHPDWLAMFAIWLDIRFGANDRGKDFASVMDLIGVREGMIIADIGAGDGAYSFQLAERVGKTGKIYATEIERKRLALIKERGLRERISNVFAVLGGETDPRLPEDNVDMIFLRHTLHCMTEPDGWLKNLKLHIHPDTKLVIIDGDPDILGYGWEYVDQEANRH